MPTESIIHAVLLGGGVAAIIGGIFAFINSWQQRRAEERRQIRELAVQVALENWKLYKANADALEAPMQPIDTFLIHSMLLVGALDGSLKTPDQILRHLRAAFAATKAAAQAVDEWDEEMRSRNRKQMG